MAEYLLQNAQKPFQYGKLDCVMYSCGAVDVITGKDILEGERWGSLKEGKEILKRRKLGLLDIFDRQFPRLDNKRKAQRGDIAARQTDTGWTFGVVWEGMKVYFKSDPGLQPYPIKDCEIVWRVC